MTLFILVTLATTGLMLAFCYRKKTPPLDTSDSASLSSSRPPDRDVDSLFEIDSLLDMDDLDDVELHGGKGGSCYYQLLTNDNENNDDEDNDDDEASISRRGRRGGERHARDTVVDKHRRRSGLPTSAELQRPREQEREGGGSATRDRTGRGGTTSVFSVIREFSAALTSRLRRYQALRNSRSVEFPEAEKDGATAIATVSSCLGEEGRGSDVRTRGQGRLGVSSGVGCVRSGESETSGGVKSEKDLEDESRYRNMMRLLHGRRGLTYLSGATTVHSQLCTLSQRSHRLRRCHTVHDIRQHDTGELCHSVFGRDMTRPA